MSIEAFVTQEDLKRFEAKHVVIKRFCLSDPDAPLAKLRSMAREAAYLEIIKRHNPSLDGIGIDDAKSVIHDFYLSNENVDVNSGAYCMDISASVIPIEIEIFAGCDKLSGDGPVTKTKDVVDRLEKGAEINKGILKIERRTFGNYKLIYNNKNILEYYRIISAIASPDGKRVIGIIENDYSKKGLSVINWDGSGRLFHHGSGNLSNVIWISNDSFRLRINSKKFGDYEKLKYGVNGQ